MRGVALVTVSATVSEFLESKMNPKIINQLFVMAQDTPPVSRARLAACIVYKREILAYGINQNKTHPLQQRYGKNPHTRLIHAETNAIHNALKRLSIEKLQQAVLYVARAKLDAQGRWVYGLAKPCGHPYSGCTKAILDFGLKQVYYTTDAGSAEALF